MRNKLRRPLALLLSAVMIVTMSGTPVHAVADRGQPETGLCEHHTAHTDDCGYTEETPGTPCGHEHTEDCYIEVTECVHEHTPECYPEETEDSVSDNEATPANAEEREPENCPHICDGESGCITEKLDCRHEHDSECGYTESTPGTPCTYVCEICNPQDSGEADEEPETGIIKQEQCSCLTLCTEGQTNPDCLVCGAEDAGLSDCKGKAEKEDTKQPEDTGICKHHQEHDDACGYQPESEDSEGSPCTYECRICPIEDLIAALPDKVTEDNADEVRAQLDEILALFSVLTGDEQEQIDLSRCYVLQEALDGANAPMPLTGAVSYVDADGTTQQSPENCTVLTAEMAGTELSGGWYVAQGDVNVGSNLFTFTEDAYLILADGCNLTGTIYAKGSLTIYAQSGGSGSLTATRDKGDIALNSDKTITINGGRITATGGVCAAIGGANQKNGTVVINGGTVTASTSGSAKCGAAIGGGAGGDGLVTINGGRVNATSSMNKLPQADSSSGAAIGGGYHFSTAGIDGAGSRRGNGTVTITGGRVSATNQSSFMPAVGGRISSVSIRGVVVLAKNDDGGAVFGGSPQFENAIVFSNLAGRVYGHVELIENITLTRAKTLHIPYGASLTGIGKVSTIMDTAPFTTENLTEDMIQVPANLGTNMTEEEIAASLTIQNPTICGATCTVTGWSDPVVAKKDGTDSTYTATYTLNSDTNVTVTKEFEVFQLATKTVKYLDETGAEQKVEATVITGDYGDRTEALRDGGWYVVEGEATRKAISAGANSHLILADGCALEATLGVNSGKSLNVYAQSVSGGQWTLPAGKDPNSPGNLSFVGIHCKGNLTVYGGSLSSTPTEIYSNGSLTVSGGSVTVKPDPSSTSSAVVDNYGVLTHNGGALTIQQDLSTFAGSGRYDTSILPENTALSAGTLADNGTDQSEAVKAQARPELLYTGQLFELVGWTLSTVNMVGNDTSKYEVTYKKDGSDVTVTLTMTLPQEAGVQTVSYLDADGTKKTAECTVLTGNLTGSLSSGWYVLKGEVTGTLKTLGDNNTVVNLILADGCHFKGNMNVYINLMKQDQLNIYAQSTGADMGRITASALEGSGISVWGQLVINGGRIISPSILIMMGSTTINGGIVIVDTKFSNTVNVKRDRGIIFEDGVGTVYGDVTLSGTHDIPAGYSLHIPAGASLSGCTLTGGGTYTTGNITEDMISVDVNALKPSEEDQSAAVAEKAAVTGTVEICGKAFAGDATGWTQSVTKVSDSEYTVTYSKDGTSVSKTVTLVDCAHQYAGYAHISGTTTHAQTCTLCGAQSVPQKCDFTQGACVCGAKLAVTLPDDLALTYNGKEQKPGVTVTVNGQTLAAANNYTVTYDNNIDAGDEAKATVTGTSFTGTFTLPFTIKPATPTIAWDPSYQVLTYTGQPADIKPVITLVNGETYDGPIYYTWPGFTNQLVLPTDAGFNGITASIPAKGNYTAAETEQALILQINKANQDAPSAPTAAEENIKGNRITLDTIENAEYKRDEGEWQTSPVFTGLDPNHEYTFYVRLKEDKNHNASPSSAGAAITTKKTMLDGATVTVSGSYTYTGAAVVPAAGNVTVELNGVTIDASQYTIGATNNVNVGTSTLTVTATADGNYSGSASTTFTIGTAVLTIKASDQTITYGQSITEGTDQVTAAALCTGDTLKGITLDASTKNVPGGTITPSTAQIQNSSGADVAGNYNITYQPGTLTINKAAAPAITWPAANGLTYGQKLSESTLSGGSTEYGSFAWKNPDTVPTAGTSGYSVTFTPSNSTEQNYEPIAIKTQDVNVTVAQAAPTVTVAVELEGNAGNRTANLTVIVTGAQNGAAPTGEITITGNGETKTLTLADGKATHTWDVSDKEYTVTAVYSGDTNYKAANGQLSFDAAKKNQESFAISPVEAKTYGDPAFELATTGGNGSGTVSFTSSDPSVVSINDKAATICKAGTVTITARKAADNNYNEAVAAISLTIGKRPITLTADSFTVVKGATMPTLTYQTAGLVNSDTFTTDPTMTTSVSDTNTLGEYAIVISGGILTNGDSYQITYVNGKLTVTDKIPVQLTIAATPDSLTGGGTVTLTISGLPAGGEATVSCSDSSINVTGSGTSWKATLPNETATYTFTANYSGDTQHSSAMATCTVSVTKRTNGGGSSGGGNGNSGGSGNGGGSSSGGGSSNGNNGSSGGGSTIVARPDETKPDTPTTSQTKPATPDKNGNVAVDNGTVQSAINAAKNDAKKNGNTANGVAVVIPVTPKEGQNSFNVTINAQTLNTLVREKVKRLEINIEGVVVGGMDTKLLKWLDTLSANGDVIFRVKKTDPSGLSKEAKAAIGTRPVYDLSLVYLAGGKETPITDFDGHTIAVRLPYAPAKEEQAGNLYAVYVDGKGKVEWLTKSSYDPDLGTVVFETGHFSIYGIGYKNPAPAFMDIKNHWAEHNIIFAASRGLLTGTGNNQFSPDTGMTRGMFVTALGRLAGIDPDSYKTGKFTDMKADAYYAPYVNWAAEKGIVNGTTATTFSPDTNITREQMAVIMASYAKKLGYDLPAAHEAVTFADNAQISGWAAKEVKAMQQAGILAGKGGNRFDPKGTATRAEVATVLRRFVEIVIDPQTAQGWMQNHSGSWQYLKNGKPVTGWLQDDKKWYWLDSNGWMFTGGWKQIDGKWYYFHSDGSMAVNTTIDGYTIGPDGARK